MTKTRTATNRWLSITLVIVSILVIGYVIWLSQRTDHAASGSQASLDAQDVASARAKLDGLQVVDRGNEVPGYTRDKFGAGWASKNGCDTRNEILQRDLDGVKLAKDSCVVTSGVLQDPYTGETIDFERSDDAAAVQIDHVVALSNAWQSGAKDWTADKRRAFANDPANLMAVEGRANTQKGDQDASTWLPDVPQTRCVYVADQISVKSQYGLSVSSAEKRSMSKVLDGCG